MKNLFRFTTAALLMGGFASSAQQLPILTTPTKGDTVNMSIQNGSRSQLSFGSSTSLGTSVSLTATEGVSTAATSSLAPASGATLSFSIGSGDIKGTTSANIDNLRAQGGGATNVAGAPINSTESTFSSGKAELTGVQSQLNITLDNQKTGFTSRTNTLHSAYGTTVPGQDGAPLKSGTQTSNASGSANINSNTNVDINSTSFTSVFMQAF